MRKSINIQEVIRLVNDQKLPVLKACRQLHYSPNAVYKALGYHGYRIETETKIVPIHAAESVV